MLRLTCVLQDFHVRRSQPRKGDVSAIHGNRFLTQSSKSVRIYLGLTLASYDRDLLTSPEVARCRKFGTYQQP
jgi:hypothetical protein